MPCEDEPLRVVVEAATAGRRLDQMLAAAVPQLSRSRLKALIAEGAVASAGAAVGDPALKVRAGQIFDIMVPDPQPAVPAPQALDLAVVYEDDALLVIDKPAGLVVHPAAGHGDGTLVNALLAHCGGSLSGIGGVVRPGIVHRLDKETSGLMVVAKTDQAHRGLAGQFADRSLWRGYTALVRGVPRPGEGVIDAPIGRSTGDRKRMAVRRRDGKPAVTRYRLVRGFAGQAAELALRLDTGRTHQIRVHLASIGHPVLGDPIYGRRPRGRDGRALEGSIGRQALHAAEIGFRHPDDGRAMRFTSALPMDMAALAHHLEALGASIPE